MEARRLTREEWLEAEKIRSISFLYPFNEEEARKSAAGMSEERLAEHWGCFEKGRLIACVHNHNFTVHFDGGKARMGGVAGVATLPEYRYGGAVKTIFERLLREGRASGEVFSALYPFSHEFYRKVGYEMCLPRRVYQFPVTALKGRRHDGWARRMEKGESVESLKKVYNAFAPRYNLMLDRGDERYAVGDYAKQQFTLLLGAGKRTEAFVQYRLKREEGKNVLEVGDLAWTNGAGFDMILGYLARMSADFHQIRMPLPDDVPLWTMLPEPYDLKCQVDFRPMARLVNARSALEMMAREPGVAFTVRVTDDFLPENSGVYRVADGGVEKAKGRADISLDARTLTLLVLGALSLDQAARRSDVRLSGGGEALRAAFPGKPMYLADYF